MAIVSDKLLRSRKKVFDKLTVKTRDQDAVSLLKPSTTGRTYDTVLEVQNAWFFKEATTKQNALLEVARDDQEMTDAMAEATHLQLGDITYVIVQADTIPPSGFAVTWKIFVERFTKNAQFNSLS